MMMNVDPRAVLSEIAADAEQSPVHRIRAAKALLTGEPRKHQAAPEIDADPISVRAQELAAQRQKPDSMPTIGTHRGLGLHDFQSASRIGAVVKPAIDLVIGMSDSRKLAAYAEDQRNPPEARLLAADRARAMHELRASAHEKRDSVDLGRLGAATAGVDSLGWADPGHYCCLLDVPRPPGEPGAPRRPAKYSAQLIAAQRAAE